MNLALPKMSVSHFHRVLLCRLAVVWGLTMGLIPPAPAQDINQMATEDVANRAAQLINARKYQQAVPYLQRMIVLLRGRTDNAFAKKAIEFAYFQLAVADLELKKPKDAVTKFNAYLQRFPDGSHVRAARLLRGVCHAELKEWTKVAEQMETLLQDYMLTPEQHALAYQLLGEAYFRQKHWEKAIKPLTFVFSKSTDSDVRTDAAVMITTCLVKLERFTDLYRFIPRVYQTPAKYDVGLNLALIEGGDKNADGEKYDAALLLYRLIFFKSELVAYVNDRIAKTEKAMTRVDQFGGLDPSKANAAKGRLKRVLADLQAQLKRINEYPDYDQELVFRMATCYYELERFWEALVSYRSIFEDYPAHALAERGLFSTFSTALSMEHIERALVEGYVYVEAFPKGEYWDQVTLTLAQIHLDRGEWNQVIAIAQKAIKVHPGHNMIDQMLYLIGYSHFQLEDFGAAVEYMDRVRNEHPDSLFREPAEYWHAMCRLFVGAYAAALDEFEAFKARYLGGIYFEDASYRLGVAAYGDDDFEGAEEILKSFVREFPESGLIPDSYNLLGDITASYGALDEAFTHYFKARDSTDEMVQINYSTFQVAKLYELENRWEDVEKIFRDYLRKFGDQANFTEATYWIGTAASRTDRQGEALQTFFEAIITYGNDPWNHGVDMILRDLVDEWDQYGETQDRRDFMERLHVQLEKARQDGRHTLELRLVALFALTARDEEIEHRLANSILRDNYIEDAGPISLMLMGREAEHQGRLELARKIYEHFLLEHARSDLSLDAMKGMASMYLHEGKHAEAEVLLDQITLRYPQFEEAGWARKRLADSLRMQKKYDQAIEIYNLVLSVKDWRGPLWPESLYSIGLCEMERGNTREAFAYFQRVYVLYEGYPEWMAKGYLKSAECLEKLGLRSKAVAHLQEMIGREELADTEEIRTAREHLARWGASS